MNDAFLPGNGFDTYEEQDRVLMGLSGIVRSGVAVRILQTGLCRGGSGRPAG